MSIKVIIGIIAAIAVLGGGAWYASTQGTAETDTAPVEGSEGESGTGTVESIFALGGSRECEVSVTTPESPASGTLYVSGGLVRSDIVAKPANVNMEIAAHMVRKDGYIYSWTDMVNKGVKVKESDTTEVVNSTSAQTGFDASAEVRYSCKPWIPDASKFELPSGMTFMEFGASGAAGAGIPAMPR